MSLKNKTKRITFVTLITGFTILPCVMACRLRNTALTERKRVEDAIIYAYDEHPIIPTVFLLFLQIPSTLRGRLSIETHSAVKVCHLRCTPKVALAVSLQPLRPLVSECGSLLYCVSLVTTLCSLTFHYSCISCELYLRHAVVQHGANVM